MTDATRQLVRRRARFRCEYCQSAENFAPDHFDVDHIFPRSLGGTDDIHNLALSCSTCNGHKAARTSAIDPITREEIALFHPRRDSWNEHFEWSEDFLLIVPRTIIGRALIFLLDMNRERLLNWRRAMIAINEHPPDDAGLGVN